MMRGVSAWAVAVGAPAPDQIADGRRMQLGEATRGDVQIQSMPLDSVLKRHRWMRVPIVRGVIALGESLRIGFEALNISVNTHTPDEEAPSPRAPGSVRSPSPWRSPSGCSSCCRSR